MNKAELDAKIQQVISTIQSTSDRDREAIWDGIRTFFCIHCGEDRLCSDGARYPCPCTYDE